ncbi:MAG: glycosyltransferase family 4 protein [Chloroflexia bacterium]|nr:glycosyltransferase family 4 protein [Chloroflexia bacterium]
MRLVIGIEQRFVQVESGTIWSNGMGSYEYWKSYLQAFDQILVVARVEHISEPPEGWVPVTGPAVEVHAAPYYVGSVGYLRHALAVKTRVPSAVRPEDAIMLRSPGPIGNALLPRDKSRPYGVEVIGDPWDVLSRGAIVHPLRPILRRYFHNQLQRHCKGASAIGYVTREALQARYPAGPNARAFQVTDGVDEVRCMFSPPSDPEQMTLVFVGSLAQMYKAPDVLLQAIAICRKEFDLNLSLVIVGDGKHRDELNALAHSLGIEQQVEFTGELPSGSAVRNRLDQADLFVLPSRTEGLPRALIEAMARGLPAIGSRVGGFSELLAQEDLVKPGHPEDLAHIIRDVVTNPQRMEAMSCRNLTTARRYLNDDLQKQRIAFQLTLREQTRIWAATQSSR